MTPHRRHLHGAHRGVPWRSNEVSRIEALSDAVFAFAVTLLVVALEVPTTFAELWTKMHGFVAFAACFAMLFQVWYSQHIFFRRYGLQDAFTILMNGALLFIVLVYVYPLKFLFGLLANELTGGRGMTELPDGRVVPMVANDHEAQLMMLVYGIGFTAVFVIFVILYWHALRQRDQLELAVREVEDAKYTLAENLMMVGVGLMSLLVLEVTGSASHSGATYMLIGVGKTIFGFIGGRRDRLRETQIRAHVPE